MTRPPLVVGADVGGTSTKVAVADRGGALLGYAVTPGGNIRSSPRSLAENLREALMLAVPAELRRDVVGGVLGIAGAGPARSAEVSRIARAAWSDAGLTHVVEPTVSTDLDIAFAAGSDHPDGLLLLAGTGAIACWFTDWHVVDRCDGMGWILGDEGSGVWIGTAALRAVAAHLDGRGPATALTDLVLTEIARGRTHDVVMDDPRQELIRAVDDHAPSWFGAFARTTALAADAGDAVANRIVIQAADALVRTAQRAAHGRDFTEVILAGAVLTTPGPVSDAVNRQLAEQHRSTLTTVRSPVTGALVLAARAAGWSFDRAAFGAAMLNWSP
ncbi:MAG: N-acetylglucosamine kinase [Cellulomonas sp.]